MLHQVELYEAAARRAEAIHSADGSLVKIYLDLGAMYAYLAMYPQSELALRRAIVLLRGGSQSELAQAIEELAMLHVVTGKLREAEKEGLEALQIREQVGDQTAIAVSWNQLGMVYLKRHEFKKAVELGQRAMEVLDTRSAEHGMDWIMVRFATAKALCESGSCGRAIPLLQEGIEQAKAAYGEDSLPVGLGSVQLGVTYWHDGATVDAARWLERGTALLKTERAWGHPVYIDALRDYAKFLRQQGTSEAALVVEREIRQADEKVDVSTLTTASRVSSGLR